MDELELIRDIMIEAAKMFNSHAYEGKYTNFFAKIHIILYKKLSLARNKDSLILGLKDGFLVSLQCEKRDKTKIVLC